MLFKYVILASLATLVMAAGECKGVFPGGGRNVKVCNGVCKQISSDPDNCGDCGVKCASSEKCFDFACVPATCSNKFSTCPRGKSKNVACSQNDDCYCFQKNKGKADIVCAKYVCGVCTCQASDSCTKDSDCKAAPGGTCVEPVCCPPPAKQCVYTDGC